MMLDKTSTEDLLAEAKHLVIEMQSRQGKLMSVVGEINRREAFRIHGATSTGAWLSQQCGVSEATGRAWTSMGQKLWDLPQTAAAFEAGDLTYDKVQVIVRMATPETDAAAVEEAKECSVRELNDLAKMRQGADDTKDEQEYEGRYVRFNDERRTVSVQLDRDCYASFKNQLVTVAKSLPQDGMTKWDQRLADALAILAGIDVVSLTDTDGGANFGFRMGNSANHAVVVHTDLDFLKGGEGSAEIERLGLIARETIERISCDARIILGVDDDLGHTMFEGRAHRFPTDTQRREVFRRDRYCRFPGCTNGIFTDVHHIVHWIKGGLTDLPNLVLLCRHHHNLLHSKPWSMSGDANQLLSFVGPSGQLMTSRPSRLWDRPKSKATMSAESIRPGRAPTS
jgi:Domain of unknown function (DUF222)/HNH endonuclease